MNNIELVESSPAMLDDDIRESMQPKKVVRAKYPFAELRPGISFTVPYDGNKGRVKSLRVRAKQLTKDGIEYSVIVHEDKNLIEVGRVK